MILTRLKQCLPKLHLLLLEIQFLYIQWSVCACVCLFASLFLHTILNVNKKVLPIFVSEISIYLDIFNDYVFQYLFYLRV